MTILTNANYNPLVRYLNLTRQFHKQLWGEKAPIYCPLDRSVPFQLITASSINSITVELFDEYDTKIETVNQSNWGIKKIAYTGYNVWINKALTLATDLTSELQYLKITAGADVYYSDLFKPIDDTTLSNDCVSIEYWNNSDISIGDYKIYHGTSTLFFRWQIFVNARINSTIDYEDTVSEREKRTFLIKSISDIEYNFGFWCTAQMLHAVRLIKEFDYISITHRGEVYKVQTLEIQNTEWNEKQALTWVEFKFRTDNIVEKFASAKPTLGDFNDDYNDYFLI